MIKLIVLIIAVLLAVQWNSCTKIPGEIVSTKSGDVQGITSISRDGREFYEWRGIPYAKAPVGALRFATPEPVEPWPGVRDGSDFGAKCIQVDLIMREADGAEDCLFLNIHTPKAKFNEAKQSGKLLPVLFWIHGGYFHFGSGDFYRGNYFMDEDVVLVTINYRLGIFGFLSTQDENARGNMGLKDQSLALRWVKDNIGNFGGNPEQITIFGESAGGCSVHFQMISPQNNGLITRAISQSGTGFAPWAINNDPVSQAKIFAENIGCTTQSTKDMVDCFRRIDAAALVRGHLPTLSPEKQKHDMFVPVIEKINDDQSFLAEHPEKLYAEGKVPNIPWLTGLTADEGIVVAVDLRRNETFRRRVIEDWSIIDDSILLLSPEEKKHSDKIRKFYLGDSKDLDPLNEDTLRKLIQMSSDRYFCNAGRKSVEIHSKVAPVYPYWYSKKGPSFSDLMLAFKGEYHPFVELALDYVKTYWNLHILGKGKLDFGVGHGDDVAMQFQIPMLFNVPASSQYYSFSKAFIKAWVSFAKGQHPQFKDLKFATSTNPENLKYLYINDDPQIISYPHAERYNFWKQLNVV